MIKHKKTFNSEYCSQFQCSVPFQSELCSSRAFTSHLLYLASLTLVLSYQTSEDKEEEEEVFNYY